MVSMIYRLERRTILALICPSSLYVIDILARKAPKLWCLCTKSLHSEKTLVRWAQVSLHWVGAFDGEDIHLMSYVCMAMFVALLKTTHIALHT